MRHPRAGAQVASTTNMHRSSSSMLTVSATTATRSTAWFLSTAPGNLKVGESSTRSSRRSNVPSVAIRMTAWRVSGAAPIRPTRCTWPRTAFPNVREGGRRWATRGLLEELRALLANEQKPVKDGEVPCVLPSHVTAIATKWVDVVCGTAKLRLKFVQTGDVASQPNQCIRSPREGLT